MLCYIILGVTIILRCQSILYSIPTCICNSKILIANSFNAKISRGSQSRLPRSIRIVINIILLYYRYEIFIFSKLHNYISACARAIIIVITIISVFFVTHRKSARFACFYLFFSICRRRSSFLSKPSLLTRESDRAVVVWVSFRTMYNIL